MKWFNNLKIGAKLLLSFFIVALICGAMGAYSIINLKSLDNADTELYENMTVPVSQMAEISTEFQRIRVAARDMIIAQSSEDIQANIKKIETGRANIDKLSTEFEKTIVSTDMKKEFETFKTARTDYRPKLDKVIDLAKLNSDAEATAMLSESGETGKASIAEQSVIEKIVDMKIADAKAKSDLNTLNAEKVVKIMIFVIIIVFAISILIGLYISKIISNPIKRAVQMIEEMSKGHLGMRLKIDSKDEVGQMAKTMDNFADALQSDIVGIMNRISQGDVSMDIPIKDEKDEIAPAMKKMVETIRALVSDANMLAKAAIDGKLDTRADATKHSGDFRRIVEGVNNTLDSVIGPLNVAAEYVDRISKGDLPPKITDTYYGDFNEIKNNLNNCIDNIKELVTDADMLANAAIAGKLDARADATKHGGDFKKIVEGVNNTLDSVIGPLNVAAEYVDRISKGDLPPKITDTYYGDFNEIKNNLNNCIDNIKALVTDADMLANAAIAGKLDTRADATKHGGDFKKIVDGVNGTLDTVVEKTYWYESILDAVPFPVSVTDLNMNWTFLNKATENLAGMKRKDAVGKQCSNWNANICKTENCGVNCLRRNKLQTTFEQNNSNFQVDSSYIKNAQGEEIGHVEIIQDITARLKGTKYLNTEVNRLAGNLKLLSEGDLKLDLSVEEGDEYTINERNNFIGINKNLEIAKEAIQLLVTDANMLAKAAIDGKLDTRADATKHGGDFRKIVEGVNNTLDSVIGPLNVAAEYVDRISKGDIPPKIIDTYYGDFNEIKNNLNNCIDVMNGLLNETNNLAKAAQDGKLDTRGNSAAFAGGWGALISGVNDLIEAVVKPVNEVTNVMGQISEGNLEASVNGIYKGEFHILAQAVNTTTERLKHVVGQISDIISEISEGNLAIDNVSEFRGDFKSISNSLNTIVESLNNVFGEMNVAAEQVSTGSNQVSDGSQALSQGATEQASAIEELTSSITEVAAQTKENAGNSNQANLLSLKVKENAEQGNKHMSEMLKSMGEINESSANISKIIKVIDEIAFQTNILALNAAVEAARAGQHGKGFAVVAEEVRNLAARSANAAKETTALIEGSIKKAEKGTEIANDTAKALYEIVDGVSKVTTLVAEIAASSNEQANGISQINLGIEQVSQVVQTNSATAEESAAASEELSSQAELLKDMVSKFKLRNENMSVLNKESKNYNKQPYNKQSYNRERGFSYKEVAATSNKPKIALSDKEFGKY